MVAELMARFEIVWQVRAAAESPIRCHPGGTNRVLRFVDLIEDASELGEDEDDMAEVIDNVEEEEP